jgi:hypothetical protein
MMVPIPVWCFLVGALAFMGALGSAETGSFWQMAALSIVGAFLWFLGVKEWRHQHGRPSTSRRRMFGCRYCGCLGVHLEDCPVKRG